MNTEIEQEEILVNTLEKVYKFLEKTCGEVSIESFDEISVILLEFYKTAFKLGLFSFMKPAIAIQSLKYGESEKANNLFESGLKKAFEETSKDIDEKFEEVKTGLWEIS